MSHTAAASTTIRIALQYILSTFYSCIFIFAPLFSAPGPYIVSQLSHLHADTARLSFFSGAACIFCCCCGKPFMRESLSSTPIAQTPSSFRVADRDPWSLSLTKWHPFPCDFLARRAGTMCDVWRIYPRLGGFAVRVARHC